MMRTFSAVAAFILIGGAAAAATVDFEGFTAGDDITGVDLGGVSLTRGGDAVVVTSNVPGGGSTRAIKGDPFTGNMFRADFTGTVDAFSVDLGDFGQDSEILIVEAYSATDVLLDSASFANPFGANGLETLSVTGSGIDYVLFGSSGSFDNSILADNLTFNPVAVVPLPAGGILLVSSLLGFGIIRRRRKT